MGWRETSLQPTSNVTSIKLKNLKDVSVLSQKHTSKQVEYNDYHKNTERTQQLSVYHYKIFISTTFDLSLNMLIQFSNAVFPFQTRPYFLSCRSPSAIPHN